MNCKELKFHQFFSVALNINNSIVMLRDYNLAIIKINSNLSQAYIFKLIFKFIIKPSKLDSDLPLFIISASLSISS